jgi:hypothetical protein
MKFALVKETTFSNITKLASVELTEEQYIDVATELLLRGWQKDSDRYILQNGMMLSYFEPLNKKVKLNEIKFETVDKLLEWY